MSYVRGFALFWWDFIVGDSIILAVGTLLALALGALVALESSTAAEIVLPSVIALTLVASLFRR